MQPLIFSTQNQGMTFAVSSSNPPGITPPAGTGVSAYSLTPGVTYDVFVSVQNTTSNEILAGSYMVQITTSNLGIGDMGGLLANITATPLIAPNGVVPIQFEFTPGEGHQCIYAQIIGFDSIPLPLIGQNTQTIESLPSGSANQIPFFVYGVMSSTVELTMQETDNNGVIIAAGSPSSWQPKLSVLDATGPDTPTPAPITLTGLNPSATQPTVALLTVTPILGSGTHNFEIVGYIPPAPATYNPSASNYVGEVGIKITAGATTALPAPAPYVWGGQPSPSISLYNIGSSTPLSTTAELNPNTKYQFSATINNASPTPAYNTIVSFWMSSGGVGNAGVLLDTKNVTVPGNGSIEVFSSNNFISAPGLPCDNHRCAVVSIYNAMSNYNTYYTSFGNIPYTGGDPGLPEGSAWYNTNSMVVSGAWRLQLCLGEYNPLFEAGLVEVDIEARYVPAEWNKNEKVVATAQLFAAGGVISKTPYYLLPGLKETLEDADLKIKVNETPHKKSAAGKMKFEVNYNKDQINSFEVSGILPKGVKKGDIMLVNVTANFKGKKGTASRSVGFLQVLNVNDK